MPIPFSTTPYCTRADAQAVGCTGDDAVLDALIQDASRVVDAYVGTVFDTATEQTVVVSDVRKPLVRLPTPFSDITEVKLNGGHLDPTAYIVEDWGLRLYSLSPWNEGWPIRGGGDAGSWPAQASGAPYGSQVEVTATFGYPDIPRLVTMATKKLCRFLQDDQGEHYLPGQTELKVGEFEARFSPQDPHPLDTTGDIEVDQLLFKFKAGGALVR